MAENYFIRQILEIRKILIGGFSQTLKLLSRRRINIVLRQWQ